MPKEGEFHEDDFKVHLCKYYYGMPFMHCKSGSWGNLGVGFPYGKKVEELTMPVDED